MGKWDFLMQFTNSVCEMEALEMSINSLNLSPNKMMPKMQLMKVAKKVMHI